MSNKINERYIETILNSIFKDDNALAYKTDVRRGLQEWFGDKYISYWNREDIQIYLHDDCPPADNSDTSENSHIITDEEWAEIVEELSNVDEPIDWDCIEQVLRNMGLCA